MSQTFIVKALLDEPQAEAFALRFGLKVEPTVLVNALRDAFSDYILLA